MRVSEAATFIIIYKMDFPVLAQHKHHHTSHTIVIHIMNMIDITMVTALTQYTMYIEFHVEMMERHIKVQSTNRKYLFFL